jgi:hypothetical protein
MIPPNRSQLSNQWSFYAAYVRALTVTGEFGEDFHNEDYHPKSFLKLSRIAEQPVLPHLKGLSAYGSWLDDGSAPSILATILSQTVVHLEIILTYQTNYQGILEIIQQQCPKLQFLQMLHLRDGPSKLHCDMLYKWIPSFRSLRVLRLEPLAGECALDGLLASIGPNLLQLEILDFQSENHFASSLVLPSVMDGPNKLDREIVGTNLPSLDSLLLGWESEEKKVCCSLGNTIGKAFGHNHPLRLLSVVHSGCFWPDSDSEEKGPENLNECISHYCKAFGSVFPFLERFHLKHYNTTTLTLRLEVVKFICTRLTELSLAGYKIADNSGLPDFLTCCPSLVKLEIFGLNLGTPWFARSPQDDTGLFVEGEIAEGGRPENTQGIGLGCLVTIKDHLPHLKQLKLTLVASATEPLQQALQPFSRLERLELVHSFWKFQHPNFNHEKAARFISSFMNSTTKFLFQEDESLRYYIPWWDEGRENSRNKPWREHSKDYHKFCEQLRKKVGLAYDARLDERQRILQSYDTPTQG